MAEKIESAVSYRKLRNRANQRYCKVNSNTQEGWFKTSIPLISAVDEGDEKAVAYLFEVELTSDPELESSDVMNLQYFFIRTEYALRQKHDEGENALFILLVQVHNDEDSYRVSSYLYLQSLLRRNMRFYIRIRQNDRIREVRHETSGIGRLPPLICVARQNNGGDDPYVTSGNDYFYSYHQFVVKETLSDEHIRLCAEEVKSHLCSSSDGNSMEETGLFNRLKKVCKFSPFQLICANYLSEALTVQGTSEHSLTKSAKEFLVDELCNEILAREPETATPLTLLIWFIYLYYMQINKELFQWSEEDGKYVLLKNLIGKSFLDSREYADGVLQLMENSCQHTQNGISYLSIRVHHVDRDCRESDLTRIAKSRSQLISRYSRNLAYSGEPAFSLFPRRLSLEKNIPYYFELRVADDAMYRKGTKVETRGIPAMHAQNRGLDGNVELCHVFGHWLPDSFNELSRKNLDNVTYHYGVRQLQKIVLRNGGSFLVSTPSKEVPDAIEIYSAYYETQLPKPPKEGTWKERIISERVTQRRDVGWQQLQIKKSPGFFATEYQILLPIGGAGGKIFLTKPANVKPATQPLALYALKDGMPYTASRIYRFRDIFSETLKADLPFTISDKTDETSKKPLINKLKESLKEKLSKDSADDIRTIYTIDFSGIKNYELEYAAKALFMHIGLKCIEQTENSTIKRQLYAVYFNDLHHMQEFILNFSVFYNENGKNPYMEGVQIAICSRGEDCLPEVNFLLAGTSLDAAWQTADIFAYYSNSDITLALLPQLLYLSKNPFGDTEPRKDEPVAPFPFDLYLKSFPEPLLGAPNGKKQRTEANQHEDDYKSVVPAPANDCWFIRQMAEIINRDLRRDKLGCKIDDVHVRLGSKMHIEDFFEAELLFQNISIVVRFAYLIVQSILDYPIQHNTPLLLVGYETYSTILLEYIVQFLEECEMNAYYGVYIQDSSGKTVFSPSAALKVKGALSFMGESNLVTIYPIGTTLSTVYRMIDGIPDEYHAQPWANFCVLVVEDKNSEKTFRANYWTRMPIKDGMTGATEKERSILTLQPDKNGRHKTHVKFYLEAKTFWHEPDRCMKTPPHEENILTYVDPTSTIPDTIFPLSHRKNDGPEWFLKQLGGEAEKHNDERLKKLKQCVSYGHIIVGNNHFLYHVDLPLYFEIVRNEITEEMKRWAETVDTEAFNIIVAPLERDNASFVQAIADSVFAHSIRIIRIPFLTSRKEDIRAKYSFISEEYRRIRLMNPDAKLHFYYVTMSLVTGETFWRASKLVNMLLEDSGCYSQGENLFKGIFTLVNRSSRSTVQAMLRSPERDFHAYLHASVPHFNTYQGNCPFCVRQRKSKLLVQNCATNTALRSFSRLERKHTVRTPEEHQAWLIEEFWNSPKDFSTLCLWLYCHVQSSDNTWLFELRKRCLALVNQKGQPIRLENHRVLFEDMAEKMQHLWLTDIMAERAYLRFVCTHKAFCVLESDELLRCEKEDLQETTLLRILNQLFLVELKSDEPPYIEWVISYVKVLSRHYLSKYHHIQQASFYIMVGMLHCLLGRPARNLDMLSPKAIQLLSEIVNRCQTSDVLPLQQYQLMMVLFHQLAEMQANMVIRGDVLKDLSLKFSKLEKEQEELCARNSLARLCPLPEAEHAEQDYIRCVKLCLLSGDEENKSLLLQSKDNGHSIWEGGL